MSVKINIHPLLYHVSDDVAEIEVDGSTVGECLEAMVKRYPDIKQRLFTKGGKVTKGLNIYINGKGTYPDVLTRPVKDGDEIHLASLIFRG